MMTFGFGPDGGTCIHLDTASDSPRHAGVQDVAERACLLLTACRATDAQWTVPGRIVWKCTAPGSSDPRRKHSSAASKSPAASSIWPSTAHACPLLGSVSKILASACLAPCAHAPSVPSHLNTLVSA